MSHKDDIQPQAEPFIVKSHDIHIDSDYADWIADIKSRYRSAQVKAAVKVNAEKLLFNWPLGCDLVQMKAEERWGAGLVEQVSLDLKRELPNANGFFSTQSLVYETIVFVLSKKWREYIAAPMVQSYNCLKNNMQQNSTKLAEN